MIFHNNTPLPHHPHHHPPPRPHQPPCLHSSSSYSPHSPHSPSPSPGSGNHTVLSSSHAKTSYSIPVMTTSIARGSWIYWLLGWCLWGCSWRFLIEEGSGMLRGCFGSQHCWLWRGWMGFAHSMRKDKRGRELGLLLPWGLCRDSDREWIFSLHGKGLWRGVLN